MYYEDMKIRSIYLLMAGVLCILLAIYILFFSSVESNAVTTIQKEKVSGEKFVFKVREEEGEVIRELVAIMAHTNPALLPFKKSKLEALGVKLRAKVTTFEFLAFVFSDPLLAQDMKTLQGSSLKYKKFIEGLFPKMLKEYEKEGFYMRANGFAKYVGVNHREFSSILKECMVVAESGDKSAFKPVIDYLISAKAR